MNALARFTLGVVLLALAPAAAVANEPPENTTQANKANEITIDLNSASQVGHVQFDVPITLKLQLDADVMQVDVFQAERSRGVACNDNSSSLTFVPTNTWRRFTLGRQTTPPAPGGQKTDAYITTDPVDANRFVCFKFRVSRLLSTAELQTFTDEAIATLDTRLRQTTLPPGGLTDPEIEAIRQDLRRVLGVTAPLPTTAVRREVPAGSMMSESPTPDTRDTFRGFIRQLLPALLNRLDAIREVNQLSEADARAVQALRNLVTFRVPAGAPDPFLRVYQQRISQAIGTDALRAAAFKPVADAIGRLLTIVDPTSEDRTTGRARAAVLGLAFDTVDTVGFRGMWAPDQVAARVKAAEAWFNDLSALRSFVAQAQPDIVSPPFDLATEIQPLRDRVNLATQEFEKVFGTIVNLQQALQERQNAIRIVATRLGDQVSADAIVGTNSFADFNTRSAWYMSVDIGVASAPTLDAVFFYVGGNVYFRPVNKDAPLSLRGGFGRRFSAMIGASIGGDLAQSGRFENSIGGNRMLLLGAGLRITDLLRAGGGFIIVKALNPNPLIVNDRSFQRTPFFGLSIDWDARTTFQNAFGDTNK